VHETVLRPAFSCRPDEVQAQQTVIITKIIKENKVKSLINTLRSAVQTTRYQFLAVCVFVVASLGVLPALAGATETEGEKKVGEVASKVGEEGVTIILAVLTALVALIALVIILPKAIGFIRRFI